MNVKESSNEMVSSRVISEEGNKEKRKTVVDDAKEKRQEGGREGVKRIRGAMAVREGKLCWRSDL